MIIGHHCTIEKYTFREIMSINGLYSALFRLVELKYYIYLFFACIIQSVTKISLIIS